MKDTRLMHVIHSNYWQIRGAAMSAMQAVRVISQWKSSPPSLTGMVPHLKYLTQTSVQMVNKLLTLKTGVPECFATETFVILHSIDDNRPTQYVRKNKNVGLLQTGSWLWKKTKLRKWAVSETKRWGYSTVPLWCNVCIYIMQSIKTWKKAHI